MSQGTLFKPSLGYSNKVISKSFGRTKNNRRNKKIKQVSEFSFWPALAAC